MILKAQSTLVIINLTPQKIYGMLCDQSDKITGKNFFVKGYIITNVQLAWVGAH
jgi:hypothetical protein